MEGVSGGSQWGVRCAATRFHRRSGEAESGQVGGAADRATDGPHAHQRRRRVVAERLLAVVPDLEQLVRRRRANQARVDDTGEAHAGDVAARAEDAVKVPDRLSGAREVLLSRVGVKHCQERAPSRACAQQEQMRTVRKPPPLSRSKMPV